MPAIQRNGFEHLGHLWYNMAKQREKGRRKINLELCEKVSGMGGFQISQPLKEAGIEVSPRDKGDLNVSRLEYNK